MKALVKTDEVILLNERTDPFVIRHLAWMQTQGYTLNENWEPPVTDGEPVLAESVTETAEETAAEETVTIDGKTYTKSELKKLLE